MNSVRLWYAPFAGLVVGLLWGASGPGRISSPPPAPALPALQVDASANLQAQSSDQVHELRFPSRSSTKSPQAAPVSSLQEVTGFASEFHRLGALARMLDSLDAAQFPTVHSELLRAQPPPDPRILSLFFQRWAQVNPEAALQAAVLDDDTRGFRSWSFKAARDAWLKHDRQTALKRLGTLNFLPPHKLSELRAYVRECTTLEFLQTARELPPSEAVNQLRQLQSTLAASRLAYVTSKLFSNWAKTDAAEAWESALVNFSGESDSTYRKAALNSILTACTESNWKAAAQLIDSLPTGPEREEYQRDYVVQLASASHTQEAKQYAFSMPEGEERRKALGELASIVCGKDPEAAKAFVESLSPGDRKDPTVFDGYFAGWFNRDPETASQLLLKFVPENAQANEEQQGVYKRILMPWSVSDPKSASEFLLKLPNGIRGAALANSIDRFCSKDIDATCQWAASLPAGSNREQVFGLIAENLAEKGVSTVTQWINSLPADTARFAATESFARTLVSVSPDDALTWIRSIPNPTERLERLRRVWQSWVDRNAAVEWLETSTALTDTERAALK